MSEQMTTTPAPVRVHDSPDAVVWSGDASATMSMLPTHSVDALITDPPYGLSSPPVIDEVLRHWENGDDYHHTSAGFMNRSWDAFVPGPSVWREALRVTKPGAPAVVFAGSRTLDLMMCAMRLAGWEILDTRHWTYASAMPKSLDVAKAIDKAQGAERHAVPGSRSDGFTAANGANAKHGYRPNSYGAEGNIVVSPVPVTDDAMTWAGWKSALKGAHEPMVLARAPGGISHPITLGNPYTAKAPADERAVAFLPSCDCLGDPHAVGADPTIARFTQSACGICQVPYVEYRHNTVKPQACMKELVAICPIGGVILDPFAGTGSTGVAAVEEGRGVILVDADPVHAAMCRSRLADLQPPLFDLFAA